VAAWSVSHYHIVEKLGAGGKGVVYKAEDSHFHRFVALKFPTKLRATRDISEEAGNAFIAMEFIDGHSLPRDVQGAISMSSNG
jgi:serine/threonine protein kinase